MKKRFNIEEFLVLESVTKSIIRELAVNKLSHKNMLDLREDKLYNHKFFEYLPNPIANEFNGMIRGAVEAWLASETIVWAHFYRHKWHTKDQYVESQIEYSKIEKSNFVWQSTMILGSMARIWS